MAVGLSLGNKGITPIRMQPKEKIAFRHVLCNDGPGIKRLYHSDNLDALSFLQKDSDVCGKVTLIYIDPPYNTGGVFETRDFKLAYADKYDMEEYLCFMRKRFVIMRELLSEAGSIYVHLDSNMVFHIKVIMDEIFGRKNFKGMITRKKCKSKNFTRKTYGNISDYILFYTKTDNPIWNRPYQEWDEDKISKEYPFIEADTGRRYKRVPIHAPGTRNGATGEPWHGMMPPEGKHWQFTPDKLEAMDKRGEIYWSANGNPRRKVYLDQSKGVPVQDIWLDFLDIDNQNTKITGYPTEKNIHLLERIIEASSKKGDIVMDCFAGSGTTLVAAEKLDRQWIGIDIGEEAIATIKKRFGEGTKPLGSYVKKKKTTDKSIGDLFGNVSLYINNDKETKEQTKTSFDLFEGI